MWADLIIIATELNIDLPEFSDISIELIEKNIKKMSDDLNNWSRTVSWIWGSSDIDALSDSEKTKLRKEIKNILNIDEEKFQEFLNQLE